MKAAKKMITNEAINSGLSGGADKPQKCSTCHKSHSGNYQKTKTRAVIQGADKICPVCNESAHTYTMRNGGQGISKRIKDCPGFKAATDV